MEGKRPLPFLATGIGIAHTSVTRMEILPFSASALRVIGRAGACSRFELTKSGYKFMMTTRHIIIDVLHNGIFWGMIKK